jgi:hypothetical protein
VVGGALGSPRPAFATGYLGAWAQARPGSEMLDRRKPG